jgi:hypothetical protein
MAAKPQETAIAPPPDRQYGITGDVITGVVSGISGGVGAAIVQQGISKIGGKSDKKD